MYRYVTCVTQNKLDRKCIKWGDETGSFVTLVAHACRKTAPKKLVQYELSWPFKAKKIEQRLRQL